MSNTATQSILDASLTGAVDQTVNATPAGVAGLTRRLADGDEEAFREFHAQYFDRLYQFLLVVTRGEEHAAQEALQETLLRVIRYARVFTDEENFWCWLKMVARSTAQDAGRKHRRYLALIDRFALGRIEQPPNRNGTDEHELGECLAEILDELNATDRQLISGKYLAGATVKELSQQTGLTDKAVESRLLRLRRQLRERLLEKMHDR